MLRHRCRNLVSDKNKAGGEGGSTFGPKNNIERKVPIRRLLADGSVEFEDGSIFPFFNFIVLLHTRTHTHALVHTCTRSKTRDERCVHKTGNHFFSSTLPILGAYIAARCHCSRRKNCVDALFE